jgi:DNA-binding transcriptional regulator YhcF (GntR family)
MEFKKNSTIYQQIVDFISEQIIAGRFLPDTKISSVREMAAKMGVNPNTVMRSYTQMQEEGIIYNKRGIGFFVSTDASDIIRNKLKAYVINTELPDLIRKMKLLDINLSEFEKMYQEIVTKDR